MADRLRDEPVGRQEETAVLENRTAQAPLGAAEDLRIGVPPTIRHRHDDIPGRPPVEAEERPIPRLPAGHRGTRPRPGLGRFPRRQARRDPAGRQFGHERRVDGVVESLRRASARVGPGHGDRERDITPVEDGASAARPADDRQTLQRGESASLSDRLECPQRQRRLRPGGDPHEHPIEPDRLGG